MKLIGRHRQPSGLDPVEPRSFVELLRSQEDLEDALRRAARFERRVAQITSERADRYEARIPSRVCSDALGRGA